MEKQLEELSKACSIAEKAGVEMLKSHVKAYTRQDGSQVAEHEDSRSDTHHVDADFGAGMKAHMSGKPHFESPHKHSSPRGQKWLEGWKHQRDNENNKD